MKLKNIAVEEPNHGTIVEVVKPTSKTYHYTNPQYTPGEGGQGYVTAIGIGPKFGKGSTDNG